MALARASNGFWVLLVLLLGVGVAYALLVGKPALQPQELPQVSPPLVEVVEASPGTYSLSVQTQGSVRPRREIQLVSQVGGLVESVSPRFAEGGFFVDGETLVKVEDTDYQFVIARAESQVAAARQKVAEEQGRALQAKREWRDLGSDQANDLFLRKPQLASAQAALGAAKADLAAAELDLSRTRISAPFNGRISEKFVDLGQYVAPGTAIAAVYDTDVALVRLPLTDRQVELLDLPLNYYTVEFSAPAVAPVIIRARFGGRMWEWRGRIVRTDASIDVNSRAVFAVAEVDKPFAQEAGSERPPLAPGLFVSAEISGREFSGVSLLPRSALRSDDTVLLVDEKNTLRMRVVKVLQTTPEKVWLQGLQAGEQVLVQEPEIAFEGMEVLLVRDDQMADEGS